MIDVLRIAHLRIAPQEGNLEVGNCEGNLVVYQVNPQFKYISHLHSVCVWNEVGLN